MIRSTTSSISTAITSPPPSTEPSARKPSRSGPRSLVPRLWRRPGSTPPPAAFGQQVDGAVGPPTAIRGSAGFLRGLAQAVQRRGEPVHFALWLTPLGGT